MGLQIESLKRLYCKHSIATEFADGEIYKFVQEDGMLMINDIFKGNAEDLNFLIELGKELKTQDTLGTRKPAIFKIQDIQTIGGKKELAYVGEFLTRKAAKKHLKKYEYRFNEPKIYIAYGGENEELTKLTEALERLYEMNCKEVSDAQQMES